MPLPCETRSTDLVGLISQSGKHSISSFEWKRKITRHLPRGLSGRTATSLPRVYCAVAPGGSVPEVAQGKVQSGKALGPALSDDEASSLTYLWGEAGRGTTEPLSRALRPHASSLSWLAVSQPSGLNTRVQWLVLVWGHTGPSPHTRPPSLRGLRCWRHLISGSRGRPRGLAVILLKHTSHERNIVIVEETLFASLPLANIPQRSAHKLTDCVKVCTAGMSRQTRRGPREKGVIFQN